MMGVCVGGGGGGWGWVSGEGFEGKASRFSGEVKSRRKHCTIVLYPDKTRLKPRLFLPAILAGN